MSNVPRYKMRYDAMSDCHCDVIEHDKGDFVDAGDYDTLAAERDLIVIRAENAERALEQVEARLAARMAEVKRDAERYRWLRENAYSRAPAPPPSDPHLIHTQVANHDWRSAIDEAIDAALAAKGDT